MLWEFTHDNLGYVFDPPTLVKTYRYGWVALVVSGYNNPGGKGILYVLNPRDGTILKKLSTADATNAPDVGSDADPIGLSTIRAFVPSRKDPYVLQAYGGDLKGNVWRFDLSSPNDSDWKVERIAKLTDACRQRAADYDRRAHRDRPEQQRRPLHLRRHRQAARDRTISRTRPWVIRCM